MKVLGLDIGTARVGVALGCTTSRTAQAFKTFSKGSAEAEILKIIAEYNIATVVVGLPLDQSGSPTAMAERARHFARRLEKRSAVNIVFQDEWGSSIEAKHRLNIGDNPNQNQRKSGAIDAESASIILKAYLSMPES